MIRITIGTGERQISTMGDLEETWINQQVNRRKDDGQNVCVQVAIEQDSINIRLRTPACAINGGGGRPPNQQERAIFDLWAKHGLNQTNFSGGNVVAFFKQLRNILD
jgi:hypothetical protein